MSSFSTALSDSSKPAEVGPINKSCEACRALKIRCLPDLHSTSGRCQRCEKQGRQCQYAAPQKKRPPKRTNVRVAELEKEVQSLKAFLTNGTPMLTAPKANSIEDDSTQRAVIEMGEATQVRHARNFEGFDRAFQAQKVAPKMEEVIGKGIISDELAYELFDYFVENLNVHLPVVALISGTGPEIRLKKPSLFLAIVVAAAGRTYPDIYRTLYHESNRDLAERANINGERSVELVQTTMIMAIWHYPPHTFKRLKFYQNINMAASMALEIGLGQRISSQTPPKILPRPGTKAADRLFVLPEELPPLQDEPYPEESRLTPDHIECRRTILACYVLASSVAMGLRHPNTLRFSKWMDECLEFFETSSQTAPTDKLLVAWVKLQKLGDQTGLLFSFDDPTAPMTIMEHLMRLNLAVFEKKMNQWKENISASMMNSSLGVSFYQNKLFFEEFGLHAGKFELEAFPTYLNAHQEPTLMPPNAASREAIYASVDSAQCLIKAFIAMDDAAVRNAPIITYVRCTYAVVLLIKLSVSATHSSTLQKVLNAEDIQVDVYLESVLAKYRAAIAPNTSKITNQFHKMTGNLKLWHAQQERSGHDLLIKPLNELAVVEASNPDVVAIDTPSSVSSRAGYHEPDVLLGQTNAFEPASADWNTMAFNPEFPAQSVDWGSSAAWTMPSIDQFMPESPMFFYQNLPMEMDIDLDFGALMAGGFSDFGVGEYVS